MKIIVLMLFGSVCLTSFSETQKGPKDHSGILEGDSGGAVFIDQGKPRAMSDTTEVVCRGMAHSDNTPSGASWKFKSNLLSSKMEAPLDENYQKCTGKFNPEDRIVEAFLEEIQKRPDLPPLLVKMRVKEIGEGTFERTAKKVRLDCSSKGILELGPTNLSKTPSGATFSAIKNSDGSGMECKEVRGNETASLGAFLNRADCLWAIEKGLCLESPIESSPGIRLSPDRPLKRRKTPNFENF